MYSIRICVWRWLHIYEPTSYEIVNMEFVKDIKRKEHPRGVSLAKVFVFIDFDVIEPELKF